jgi:hypothetical protein
VHADGDRVAVLQIMREAKRRVETAGEQCRGRASWNGVKQEALRLVQGPGTAGELAEIQVPVIMGEPSQEPGKPLGNGVPQPGTADRDLKPEPPAPAGSVQHRSLARAWHQPIGRIRHRGDLHEIGRLRRQLTGEPADDRPAVEMGVIAHPQWTRLAARNHELS